MGNTSGIILCRLYSFVRMLVRHLRVVALTKDLWSHRLSVRTSAFHAEKRGSIPLGTTSLQSGKVVFRLAHNQKVGGANPPSATSSKVRKRGA